MNSRRLGSIFIVLLVVLIAFGLGSITNAFFSGTSTIIPFGTVFNQTQVTQMNDSSFQPVYLIGHATTTNITTPVQPINNSRNSSNNTKNNTNNTTG